MRRLLTALMLLLASPAPAQDRAGDFDHYLLALSWIPAYCAEDGDDRDDPRCRDGRRLGWAVHGLWPQHADGRWPEYCSGTQRDPSRQETARRFPCDTATLRPPRRAGTLPPNAPDRSLA